MKNIYTVFLFLVVVWSSLHSQWIITTGTNDDSNNGTGHQTISIGAVNSSMFVALVNRPTSIVFNRYDDVNITSDSSTCNYLVGYKNATINTGRLGTYPYGGLGTAGLYSKWASGFDEVTLFRANKIVVTPDSLIYVANNDADHNILVFKITGDTVESSTYRMKTGTKDIQGLAVDTNGYVYVSEVKGAAPVVKVFKGIKMAGTKWESTYDDAPIATITLPAGVYRGLTVSGDGSQLFVSSMTNKSVVKYSGNPVTGYQMNASFAFRLTEADTIPGSKSDTNQADYGKPLGMGYLNGNNLLFVAAARWWGNTIVAHPTSVSASGYAYSKVFILNPLTGARIDSIDVAKYYYDSSGSYTTQVLGPDKFISGYASVYDVAFDEKKDLYIQSMYSWTVEKWHFNGTLPKVNLTTVRRTNDIAPNKFTLDQNYPNPFNPSTTINFAIASRTNVTLKVYDLMGKEVATLVNGELTAGSYKATFDAQKLSSGMYFYTLTAGSFNVTKKMLLLK